MIAPADFNRIVALLGEQGKEDIEWSENIKPPETADDFARDAIWVICCSGMKFTVARLIEGRVLELLDAGKPVQGNVLGKSGKAAAIDAIWRDRFHHFNAYSALADDEARLAYLLDLPWIGKITQYHLAKNLGMNVAKPDVHLARLAEVHGCTPHQLCAALAAVTNLRIATVDVVLWRACATGVLNSKTGMIKEAA